MGDSQDPGPEENIIPLNPIGEPGTIVTLAMLQDDVGDGPGKIDFFQDVIT
jgi:hypothetical protein